MRAMPMTCPRKFLPAAAAVAVMTAAAATGCGGSLTAEEQGTADEGGENAVASYQALRVADSMFAFDPTIDPSTTEAAIAAAIEARTRLQLGQCGTVTRSTSTVSVDFGSPPGCTLRNGAQISGSLTATVTKSGGTASVALVFTTLVAGSKSLAGTASFSTSNGSTFTVALDLTTSQGHAVANLTAAGSQGAMTLDGSTSVTRAGSGGATTTSSLQLQGVVWKEGDCYPSAGSAVVTRGPTTVTLTFSATTPATGQATATSGRTTTTVDLPAYGSCPPA